MLTRLILARNIRKFFNPVSSSAMTRADGMSDSSDTTATDEEAAPLAKLSGATSFDEVAFDDQDRNLFLVDDPRLRAVTRCICVASHHAHGYGPRAFPYKNRARLWSHRRDRSRILFGSLGLRRTVARSRRRLWSLVDRR